MPGRLFLTAESAEIAAFFGAPDPGPVPPRHNIAPGQDILVFDGTALRPMRWGILPVGRRNARGRPVMETLINARSETVFEKGAYDGVRRGIVPASGWYEWTGTKGRKTPWSLRREDGSLLAFAAIWDVWTAPGGLELAQVAVLTCAPNDDVKDIHHRMGVLLRRQDFDLFFQGLEAVVKPLLTPAPNGLLAIGRSPQVDWTGP